jgi:DNA-directed RNA polymerase subunit RPC12/RpoP
MVSSQRPTVKFACAACGATYEVPESMAGRRGPCAKCGADLQGPSAKPAARNKIEHTPQYAAVECRVCQTRFYGTLDQVGKKAKCPDCGALTIVPTPPPPVAKKTPAALEGEQYELWDVDAQPLPSEIAAALPKYIAISCTRCDTLMHATPDQVGQTIRCPDCGAKYVVPPLEEERPAVLPSTLDEFELDASADPGERPTVILPPVRRMLYEEEEEAERARRADMAKRGPVIDARGRPVLPSQPLLQGIFPFLFRPATAGRWLALSMGLAFVVALLLDGLSGWLALGGVNTQLVVQAKARTAEIFIAAACGFLWSAYAASVFLVVTAESSEGNDEIYAWPSGNFLDWMGDLWLILVAWTCAAAPGWAAGVLVLKDIWWSPLAAAVSLLICFPIVFLSQLAANSVVSLVHPRVLASLARCPFSWLLFYVESAMLLAICGAAAVAASFVHYLMAALLAPLYVAAMLLYARLLGRLGWRLADAVSEAD